MQPTVSAIVPAYNEAGQIERVLEVLSSYSGFHEIIVIDDGSTDDTGSIAQKFPVRYIRNEQNLGKGGAMERAVQAAEGEIIFFCDADLTGLTHAHIDSIIEPVRKGSVIMNVGMHDRAIFNVPLLLRLTPKIGGERALLKTLWQKLPAYYKTRFRIELGLNAWAKKLGGKIACVRLTGIDRIKKEQKYGFLEGFGRRLAMWGDLLQTWFHLKFARSSD